MTPRSEASNMQTQIDSIRKDFDNFKRDSLRRQEEIEAKIEKRHDENRKSIHDLRDTLQSQFDKISDKFAGSVERMGDKLTESIRESIRPIADRQAIQENEIINLKLQWARAMGYASAGAVGAGLLFEASKVVLEKIIR